MNEVTKSMPCTACGKPDWCAWSEDGERLRCMRPDASTPPESMREISRDAEAVVYGFLDWKPDHPTPSKGSTPKRTKAPSIDAEALHAEAVGRLIPERLAALVAALGLPEHAVQRLVPGWCDAEHLRAMGASGSGWGENYPEDAWAFPERDSGGSIVGLSLRAPDGRKGSPKGGARGLTIPEGFDPKDGLVLLVEGASDVAAALALGFEAVGRPSNLGGVDALAECLRGADVVVLGENDQKPDGSWPGRDGAVAVAGGLAARWGCPVRWAIPPPGVKDLRALWHVHGAAGGAMLRACIDNAEEVSPPERPDLLEYEPFPIDALPEPLRLCAESHARNINCDSGGLALAMLVACASAVSRSRVVDLGRGWVCPIVLWGCIVGAPSDGKTPALDVAMAPARRKRDMQVRDYALAMREHKREKALHKAQMGSFGKAGGSTTLPPAEPEPPPRELCLFEDSSLEALQDVLAENGGACLLARDELAAVFKAFGKHGNAKGGGGDVEAFCQSWNGGSWGVVRLGREGKHVRRACLSLAGCMTRGNVGRLFAGLAPSGLFARMLLVWPPMHEPKRWDDDRPIPEGAAAYERLWLALHALKPGVDDAGEESPYPLWLDSDALVAFSDAQIRYKREHRAAANDEPVAALLGKLDAMLGRVAGVLHLVRFVNGERVQQNQINGRTMADAVRIIDWLRGENLRCYELLRADANRLPEIELARLVARQGGSITPAELARLSRAHNTPAAAAAALHELAEAGYGSLSHPAPGPSGGRPKSAEFRLHKQRRTPRSGLESGVS